MATRHVFPQEIINLICEKCEPSTLATLARVSRVFTELALNLLWHTIPDLGPLIRCMPQDLWEMDDEIEFERPRLMFCRSILPADWDIFKVHAARVRKFGFPYTLVDLEPSAYGVLACASVGRLPLLPRLTHIRWLDLTDNVFPYINLFLSPIIICLEFDIISFNDEPDSVGLRFSLLASLVSACPNMAHLTLDGHDMSEEQVPWQEIKSGLSFIEQWSSLHYLEMVGLRN
ncbi:hypothetical protein APHAL10511_004478 [Amanita phalloides]|nr:hypothetical protein APHAL10511_004478 [Amanita phalloides]